MNEFVSLQIKTVHFNKSQVNLKVKFYSYLETVGLCESRMANIALVGFFASMDAQVALQLEGVRAGIRTVRTLVGSLTRMAPHMTLELA